MVPGDIARVRIDVTDGLDVDVTATYVLRGEASKPDGVVIVALPRFAGKFTYLDRAMLRTVGGLRAMPRLTPDQVSTFLDAYDARKVYTATDQSVPYGSVISARWRTRIERDDDGWISPRRFRPLSKLDLDMRPNPLVSLSIHLPPIASASCIAVSVSISFAAVFEERISAELREVNHRPLTRVETQDDLKRAAEIRSAFYRLRAELRTLLEDLSTRTSSRCDEHLGDLHRSAGRDAKRALKTLRTANKKRIAEKLALVRDEPPGPPQNTGDLEEFLGYEQVLGAAVEDELELDLPIPFRTGEDVGRTIRSLVGPALTETCEYRRLWIPFTTEREPGTQGLRSAASLLLLGMFLLLISRCDLSWFPHFLRPAAIGSWFGRTPASNSTAIVGPLVAVLVIFPIALYGQFFQTRPRTDIGNSSQLSSFALHSFLFALPTIPAILAATGRDLRIVSITSVVLACVAFGVGFRLLRTYSGSRLEGLRWAELKGVLPRQASIPFGRYAPPVVVVLFAACAAVRWTSVWTVGVLTVVVILAVLWIVRFAPSLAARRRVRAEELAASGAAGAG